MKQPTLKTLKVEKDYFDFEDFQTSFIPDKNMLFARHKASKVQFQLEILQNIREEDKEPLRD